MSRGGRASITPPQTASKTAVDKRPEKCNKHQGQEPEHSGTSGISGLQKDRTKGIASFCPGTRVGTLSRGPVAQTASPASSLCPSSAVSRRLTVGETGDVLPFLSDPAFFPSQYKHHLQATSTHSQVLLGSDRCRNCDLFPPPIMDWGCWEAAGDASGLHTLNCLHATSEVWTWGTGLHSG